MTINITEKDVQVLREALECWNGLSNIKSLEDGYSMMTDHRHAAYDYADNLVNQLERMVSHSKEKNDFSPIARCLEVNES